MKRIPARAVVVGVVAPVVIVVAAVALGLTWISDLPGTIAVHWGASGTPDGFSTPLGFLLQLGGMSVGFAVLFTGIAVAKAPGGLGMQQKMMIVLSPFMSVLLMTITLVSLDAQRGLVDATAAPNPLRALILGALLGLVAAVIGWLVLPKAKPAVDQYTTTPVPTELTATDRVLWTRSIVAPRWLIAVVAAVLVIATIPIVMASEQTPWLWAIVIPLLMVTLGSLFWRVRVDNTGVVVRSFLWIPHFRVRLSHIASASVPVVNPLLEFGGWGLRLGSGRRTGVILNGGDALEVHRSNGSSLVVTVDDAAGAASLINGLVARARLHTERR